MYVLVLFRGGPTDAEVATHAAAHEEFVTSLIRRNIVVLGGDFAEPLGDAQAAYLLSCGSLDEARETVSADPFFTERVFEPVLVEWQLVGVNPDAVARSDLITPRDV